MANSKQVYKQTCTVNIIEGANSWIVEQTRPRLNCYTCYGNKSNIVRQPNMIISKLLSEFLETSTIHGLFHISTTTRQLRLLWICVVIAGFIGAAWLINESFESWAEQPVSTTVETFPIKDVQFPKVTVCPPKNTLTNINPDLIISENLTLDDRTRDEFLR